jgi:hypothetical protein
MAAHARALRRSTARTQGHGDELADGLRAELARRRPELLAAVR